MTERSPLSQSRYPYPLWSYPVWAWVSLAASLVAVLTFGFYSPRWEMDFLYWRSIREARRRGAKNAR